MEVPAIVAALIIANFNFASEVKRKKRKNQTNAIFSELKVYERAWFLFVFWCQRMVVLFVTREWSA